MLGAMQMQTTTRVVGVDVARAVALIGMFAAHLLYLEGVVGEVVYGFPSALFPFVSGISMALMAERGARPAHFVVRGALLLVLFGLLLLIPTDIIIVLGVLGASMICLASALRFVARILLPASAIAMGSDTFAGDTLAALRLRWIRRGCRRAGMPG